MWVAQCLEHDLCTAAKRGELPRKLLSQLRTQIAADILRGRRPFADLPRAPEKFWSLYQEGTPIPVVHHESWFERLLSRWREAPGLRTELALAPG